MKFEARTLMILKNFATINQSLHFRPGNQLSTISPAKTILAVAQIKETIPSEFAIYDMPRLLSSLSLFKNPDIQIGDKYLVIKDKLTQVRYTFASPDMIVAPDPKKQIVMDNPEITFTLKLTTFQSLMKAASILQLPEIAIVGNGKVIGVRAVDMKNPTSDTFEEEVGKTKHTFTMVFRTENFKMEQDTYEVAISSKGIAHFRNSDTSYWLPIEQQTSKFEK